MVTRPEACLLVWPGSAHMNQGRLPSSGWGRAWAPTCWFHGNECLPGA